MPRSDRTGFSRRRHHHHDDRIGSVVFRADRDFDGAKLQDFIGGIVRVFGDDLMRYKGVMAVDDLPYRVILQGVHMLMAPAVSRGRPSRKMHESRASTRWYSSAAICRATSSRWG